MLFHNLVNIFYKTVLFTSLLNDVTCINYDEIDTDKQYVLSPKDTILKSSNLFQLKTFAKKNNLNLFVELNSGNKPTLFYFTDGKNLKKNFHNLNRLYEIEKDEEIYMLSATDYNFVSRPWHRINVIKKNKYDEYYTNDTCYRNNGNKLLVSNYVIDTGIDIKHPEFGGRAKWGNNFVDNLDTDCNGHGTHVAGLIGSESYGMCTNANLLAVKVLSCSGSGSLSGVIRGIEWSFNSHMQNKKDNQNKLVKGIINMSLGGGFSSAINKAIKTVVTSDNDFYVVVAAGNENSDSCNTSPASVKEVLTVMASDELNRRAYFSNWGECSDIYSPGVDVLSVFPNGETKRLSGTSMASPVATGILNHYIDRFPNSNMKQIKEKIMNDCKTSIKGGLDEESDCLIQLVKSKARSNYEPVFTVQM